MIIDQWVEQTSVYPPGHIYAGMTQGKQEKQAVQVCEQLYKFNFGDKRNPLADLRATWREIEVIMLISTVEPILPIRVEYLDKIFSEFLDAAQNAINEMDKVFKQHQSVNEYYKTWRVSYQDVKTDALRLKERLKEIKNGRF